MIGQRLAIARRQHQGEKLRLVADLGDGNEAVETKNASIGAHLHRKNDRINYRNVALSIPRRRSLRDVTEVSRSS